MNELEPPPSLVELVNEQGADSIWKKWLNNLYEFVQENMNKDFYYEVSAGRINGKDSINKFGHSDAVSTTLVPVCSGNVYQTVTVAQTLELVSTAAADNQAGIGARKITIEGLDANWEPQSIEADMHATDGTLAETVTGYTWMRVFRMKVSPDGSGTYASSVGGSHQGTVTLRTSGGAGVDWAILEIHSGFPLAQSQIGAYTVPKGKKAMVGHILLATDSSKAVDAIGFRRDSANDITSPYSPMRTFAVFTGITDQQPLDPKTWHGPFDEYTDIGFMAKRTSAGTSSVSVDFEIILEDK